MSREKFLAWPGRAVAVYAYGVLTPQLTLAFFAIYGGADLLTELHDYRVNLHMDWELQVPLVPSMMLFYTSLYPACVLLPLAIRTRPELWAVVWVLVAMTAVGGVVFLACPGRAAWATPTDVQLGDWRVLYRTVDTINLRHNYCPSLHVAWAVVIAEVTSRRHGTLARILTGCWAAGVAISTMLTHQHYLVDVVTGLVLGLVGSRWLYVGLLDRRAGLARTSS